MPDKSEILDNKNQDFAKIVESRKNIGFRQLSDSAKTRFSLLCDRLEPYVLSKEEKEQKKIENKEKENEKDDKQIESSRGDD